jgi:hypothetical protein
MHRAANCLGPCAQIITDELIHEIGRTEGFRREVPFPSLTPWTIEESHRPRVSEDQCNAGSYLIGAVTTVKWNEDSLRFVHADWCPGGSTLVQNQGIRFNWKSRALPDAGGSETRPVLSGAHSGAFVAKWAAEVAAGSSWLFFAKECTRFTRFQ